MFLGVHKTWAPFIFLLEKGEMMKMEIPVKVNDVQSLYQLISEVALRNGWLGEKRFTSTHVKLPRVVCEDGFSISCQAGLSMYSIPREDLCFYDAWELGYPSAMDELIESYKEFYEDESTKCVYPYVPTDIVDSLIAKHGGIVAVCYEF